MYVFLENAGEFVAAAQFAVFEHHHRDDALRRYLAVALENVLVEDEARAAPLQAQQQPVTAEMLSLSPKDTGLPLVVISDGQLVERSLGLLRLDRDAVVNRLRNRGLRPEEVFLMTLDDCGNMFVQKKEGA